MEERLGRSRNMYKGPMDKHNGGRIECGEEWVGQGKVMGEKWGHFYLSNNKKIKQKGRVDANDMKFK